MTDEIKLELTGATVASIPVNAAAATAADASDATAAERIEESLTPEELEQVKSFAEKIDVTDTAMVLNYGAAAQTKLSQFSDSALANVRSKDLGEVGGTITDLVTQLKGFDVEEKGFLGIFKKAGNRIATLKARYDKAEVNVDKICGMLEGHQTTLLKDISTLDALYAQNLVNYKELGMYILAGRKRLQELQEQVLPELRAKAEQSGAAEDAQKANDMANYIDRFEKKVHDLELTRMVSLQMAPQIRLVQNNDSLMAEKIQSTLANTIPLWKSQMVLALGLEHSAQALSAQRAVTDTTNELLRKNAEKLKMATVETARESERGVVDMETLRQTNAMLIETLDEVKRIQDEGRANRAAAEKELGRIEGELKDKLLELRK